MVDCRQQKFKVNNEQAGYEMPTLTITVFGLQKHFLFTKRLSTPRPTVNCII